MRIPQGTRYKVRVVGDGPELEHLRKRCKDNLNLSEHVHCMGSIPYMEMEKEYADADVFIMPSIRETTGTVLLEAMSKGIPVITINKFGGATLFDENTGWLYEGNSKEEYIENLKKAILECIANPDEVTRRGKNARKKAEKYTWQDRTSGSYKTIISNYYFSIPKHFTISRFFSKHPCRTIMCNKCTIK